MLRYVGMLEVVCRHQFRSAIADLVHEAPGRELVCISALWALLMMMMMMTTTMMMVVVAVLVMMTGIKTVRMWSSNTSF